MIKDLTFITGNPEKAEFAARFLNHPIRHHKLHLNEMQAGTVEEVVANKAKEAFEQLQTPILVEDASLVFLALGRMPGPFIKWFFEDPEYTKDQNLINLCRMLDGLGNRQARAEVCFGLYDGKNLKTFNAFKNGSIADYPRGDKGMGWDPIFIPGGSQLTWGEMDFSRMPEEELVRWSLRVPLFRKLEEYLNEHT